MAKKGGRSSALAYGWVVKSMGKMGNKAVLLTKLGWSNAKGLKELLSLRGFGQAVTESVSIVRKGKHEEKKEEREGGNWVVYICFSREWHGNGSIEAFISEFINRVC